MGVVMITLVSIENRFKMSKKLRIQHPNTSTLPFDSIEGSGLNSSYLIVVEAQTCDLKKKIFFYLCRHLKIGMSSLLLYQWHINDYLTKTYTYCYTICLEPRAVSSAIGFTQLGHQKCFGTK